MREIKSLTSTNIHGVESVTVRDAHVLPGGTNARTIRIEAKGGLLYEVTMFSDTPEGVRIINDLAVSEGNPDVVV